MTNIQLIEMVLGIIVPVMLIAIFYGWIIGRGKK